MPDNIEVERDLLRRSAVRLIGALLELWPNDGDVPKEVAVAMDVMMDVVETFGATRRRRRRTPIPDAFKDIDAK